MKNIFLLVLSFFSISVTYSQGIIRGKVSDKTGETLIGVPVVLKSNRSVGVTTDLDGNYSLIIRDSIEQVIEVSYVSYQTIEFTIHPVKGEIIIKDFVMESASRDLGVVEVVAKATKANNFYMENLKKNSSATIDYVSSETMKKTGDPNVTAAVARVPGVSTSSSGFITVRGIGDRYVKTTINGSRIPTLDPYTNNIKLDIIPASLVDNIIISKTANPDIPGDFAGAYLSIETKDYPEQLAINIESSLGYNNQSTFKNVITSQRSSTDILGYDNSLRDYNHNDFIPVNIDPGTYEQFVALGLGQYYGSMGVTKENWGEGSATGEMYFKLGLVQLGLLAPANFDNAAAVTTATSNYNRGTYKLEAFKVINAEAANSGKAMPNNWNTTYRRAPLNFTQSFSIGDQTQLFGKPLGIIAGFRYGTTTAYDPNASSNRATIANLTTGEKSLTYQATEQASKETNGWSALANIAYKLNPNNSIGILFMPNFSGVNNVRHTIDSNDDNEFRINKSQFYEQRKQMIYQYKSEHFVPGPKMKIEFNTSYTNGTSSAPDFKNLPYLKDKNSDTYAIDQGWSRSYRYLGETLLDMRLAAEIPLGNKPELPRKLKFGAAYLDNQRNSEQFNYSGRFGPYATVALKNENLQSFFDIEKFGVHSGTTTSGVPYNTIDMYYARVDYPSDHTVGYSKIKAAYVMTDYSLSSVLRFAGGLRVEEADFFTDAFKYRQLGLGDDDKRRRYEGELLTIHPGRLKKVSFLPSGNLIWKLKKDEFKPINLRVNYSQTVARPSIRELTDVVVFDYELRAPVWGRSDLKMVRINNYDVRLESYFNNGDNLSVSLFYKDFKNHIEVTDAPMGGYTWINVDKSSVMGVEIEGKKTLTKRFELRANITLADSKTSYENRPETIMEGERIFAASTGVVKRKMYGQAPYVINAIFGYKEDSLGLNVALSYNVQGPRLVIASPIKQLEIYELQRHLLDFKVTKSLGKHFNASLTIRDILNAPIRRTYNYDEGWIVDYDKYRYGTNFLLGISYKL